MTIKDHASFICKVLQHFDLGEFPLEVREERRKILQRYDEYKRTNSFSDSSEMARTEWLTEYLESRGCRVDSL